MRQLLLATSLLLPTLLPAQGDAAPRGAAAVIQAAVLPLPEAMRDGATVLGWTARWATTPLRTGTGPMICLADNPLVEGYHAACYHRAMEPYMERGRALRRAGITDRATIDSIRYAEVQDGSIAMPVMAALFQLNGTDAAIDWATGTATGPVRALHVVYIPGATSESTGLPLGAPAGTPWLMSPGTPSAHLMLVPSM